MLATLPFLSSFNVSYNQLEGRIPTGNQFQTFEANSYVGNKGLCGFPLSRTCDRSIVPVSASNRTSSDPCDWQSIYHGMGPGAGSLIVIAVLSISTSAGGMLGYSAHSFGSSLTTFSDLPVSPV
ncbi:receptor-like protein 12 [Tanacetum coccineum]